MPAFINGKASGDCFRFWKKKSESLQTEGLHLRSRICKLSASQSLQILDLKWRPSV